MRESARFERVKDPSLIVGAFPHAILLGGVLLMLVVHPNAVRSALDEHARASSECGTPCGVAADRPRDPAARRAERIRARVAALTVGAVAAALGSRRPDSS